MIEVEIKEWGNSLGFIVPAAELKKLHLKKGDKVNLEILGKKRINGFGMCRGAKSFEEEKDPHSDLW